MTYVPPEPHERMLENLRHRVKCAAADFNDARLKHETLLAALSDAESVCDHATRVKATVAKAKD